MSIYLLKLYKLNDIIDLQSNESNAYRATGTMKGASTMRQKTFMCVDTWANIICENMKVGDEFILVGLTNLNGNTTTWALRRDNGGIGGNMDS